MKKIPKINFYKYNKEFGVVEIFIENEFSTVIKNEFITVMDGLSNFAIEDKKLQKDSWQAPYMEQYFSLNRAVKICGTYENPTDKAKEFLIAFFIFNLAEGQILRTPFGNVTVTKLLPLPSEYKKLLEFEILD